MKNRIYTEYKHILTFILLLSFLIAGPGCGGGEKITYTDVSIEHDYLGGDYEIFFPDTSTDVNLTYTLNLGLDPKDVFFIFTNTSESNYALPQLLENTVSGRSADEDEPALLTVPESADQTVPVLQRGKPQISDFNRNALLNTDSLSRNIYEPLEDPMPSNDTLGGTGTFYLGLSSSGSSVSASCRYVSGLIAGKTLNIWVANDCLSPSGTKSRLVTDAMVAELAKVFLKDGVDDIYTWVTDIFGDEWGTPPFTNLIDDNNEITILLYDIDNDNTTPLTEGGVAGYFYAKDNFKSSYYSGSNQRIMFYLDAVMFANGDGTDGTDWDVSDPSPGDIVSTLAHEFQHMIHFYQKQIKYELTTGTETWLDEMCSLVAEDFITMKLGALSGAEQVIIKGPRGVDGDTTGPGLPFNYDGRLPAYNYYNYISLTDWPDDDASNEFFLMSYAMSYAFGAYLARNYGGAEFFRNIVQCAYTDYRAVEYAAGVMGHDDNFTTILRNWGVANLLSDKTTVPQYEYNSGTDGFIADSLGYVLGSINLRNYYPTPFIWPYLPSSSSMYPVSNFLYIAGDNIQGANTWTLQMRKPVRLTVLVR